MILPVGNRGTPFHRSLYDLFAVSAKDTTCMRYVQCYLGLDEGEVEEGRHVFDVAVEVVIWKEVEEIRNATLSVESPTNLNHGRPCLAASVPSGSTLNSRLVIFISEQLSLPLDYLP